MSKVLHKGPHIEALRAGTAAFEPRARLLKLIGAELISDEVVALTELIKNAHDADASRVVVSFLNVSSDGGSITVTDDGHGMSLDTLLLNWMQPAGTTKSGKGGRATPRGRRVLGEKGIGRFAADKLARNLTLTSSVRGCSTKVVANFDWNQFDDDRLMLSHVTSSWQVLPEDSARHGTVLTMTNLRSAWTERMFRRLVMKASRLQSPFSSGEGFAIDIESDEFPEYAGEVNGAFIDKARYGIDATFDGNQIIKLLISGQEPIELIWNGSGELTCGPVRARFFGFDLETDALVRIGPPAAVRGWLREWSGVSVFRDGFRIWPYGEPDDDWLRLDQRRINNPVVKLSNNQVVGFVEISRDANPDLLDQTNREGLIHNQAFEDLRRLLYFVLQHLEVYRQGIRHPLPVQNGYRKVSDCRDHCSSLVAIAKRAPRSIGTELRAIAEDLRAERKTSAAKNRAAVMGFASASEFGEASLALAAIIHPLIDDLAVALREVRGTAKTGTNNKTCWDHGSPLDTLRLAMEALVGKNASGGRRGQTLDLLIELEKAQNVFGPALRKRGITLRVITRTEDVLRIEMTPDRFQRLLAILLLNSMDWLEGWPAPRIRITVRSSAKQCELIVSDNGPGILPDLSERIFDPLFSGKEGGRGMGLAIARRILSDYGGTIELLIDGRRIGASFRLCLPRRRPKNNGSNSDGLKL